MHIETLDFLLCLTKVQHHYNSTNAFQMFFWVNIIAEPFLTSENPRNHMISYQPLLYSIIVLYDNRDKVHVALLKAITYYKLHVGCSGAPQKAMVVPLYIHAPYIKTHGSVSCGPRRWRATP